MIYHCSMLMLSLIILCCGKLYASADDDVKKPFPPAQRTRSTTWLFEQLEQSVRFRTGVHNEEVDYMNHPFGLSNMKRQLQKGNDSAKMLFKPLRIHVNTADLQDHIDENTAGLIDHIIDQVLPETVRIWSNALSVSPVDGNLKISPSVCGNSTVPDNHISDGVPNADMVLYVSGSVDPTDCSLTGTEAFVFALPCAFDQYDRPIAGVIHFCLDRMLQDEDITAAIDRQRNEGSASKYFKDTILSSIAQILGMASMHFRFFWDSETGLPRTARPFVSTMAECVDGESRIVSLPDNKTLSFSRDATTGSLYASIVTPKVQTVVRNQFNCQSVEGARLENQVQLEGSTSMSSSCTGEHWDQQLFFSEVLTRTSSRFSESASYVSALTLALMEDSGWYKANYTMVNLNTWGLGSGCDFLYSPCLVPSTNSTIPSEISDSGRGYFCNEASSRGCSPGLTHKAACTIIDYGDNQSPALLPTLPFQYFFDEPSKGGLRLADYCPISDSAYGTLDLDNLDCRNANNVEFITDSINIFSEVYGSDSVCFETVTGDGRCYRSACDLDTRSLRLNVRGEWLTCDFDFQELNVRVGSGLLAATVICPRLTSACPHFYCPSNCAGRGICDYDNLDANGKASPICRCYDAADTSPGCTESLHPQYLSPSSVSSAPLMPSSTVVPSTMTVPPSMTTTIPTIPSSTKTIPPSTEASASPHNTMLSVQVGMLQLAFLILFVAGL